MKHPTISTFIVALGALTTGRAYGEPCRVTGSGIVRGVAPKGSNERYTFAFEDFSASFDGTTAGIDGQAPVSMHGTTAIGNVPLETTAWLQLGRGLVTAAPEVQLAIVRATGQRMTGRLELGTVTVEPVTLACAQVALRSVSVTPDAPRPTTTPGVFVPKQPVPRKPTRSKTLDVVAGAGAKGVCGACGYYTPANDTLVIYASPSTSATRITLKRRAGVTEAGRPWIVLTTEAEQPGWLLLRSDLGRAGGGAGAAGVEVFGWVRTRDVVEGLRVVRHGIGLAVGQPGAVRELDLPRGAELMDRHSRPWGTVTSPLHALVLREDDQNAEVFIDGVTPEDGGGLLMRRSAIAPSKSNPAK